jgi:WD40 repeat protein
VGTFGGEIRLWDVENAARPRYVGELAGHEQSVTSLAFTRDGETLASGSDDGTIRLWHVASRSPLSAAPLRGHS